MREKCWDERTDSEKLEVLRNELVFMQHQLACLCVTLDNLCRHSHGSQGQIVVPFHSNDPPMSSHPKAMSMGLRKKNDL